ncbi:hypothetical protein GCM10022409_31720 [Hymenobacter glaciei]|uniref:Uncharacterized protein n=1 Tax=Hymenobacter glaciei TaxID=877209 RepID=A0ABP7UH88_9BACT
MDPLPPLHYFFPANTSCVGEQVIIPCNKCSEKQELRAETLCDACPIHQQVQDVYSRAQVELDIRQELDTPKEFVAFCRKRLNQSIELATQTVIYPSKQIFQHFGGLGNATYDVHRDHIIAIALSKLYRVRMGYKRTNSVKRINPGSSAITESTQLSQVAEVAKEDFADHLLGYTMEELVLFLKERCLIGADNKANPSAETAAWSGAIHALADSNPPKIVGKKAALTRAFMKQFSISASFHTIQRCDTGIATRYYEQAIVLLKK